MNVHSIDLGGNNRPILTPFKFLYLASNHYAREMEFHKFQKAKLNATCPSEDNEFTFYSTLRHIAGSYNILLLPPHQVTRETGVCQLTSKTFIGDATPGDNVNSSIY